MAKICYTGSNLIIRRRSGVSHNLLTHDLDQEPQVKKRLRDYDVPFFHHVLLMLLSSLLAFSSFLPLFFKGLATSLQSQNHYIGFAFSQTQLPYVDLFSQEGFLYHAISAIAHHYGGIHWLILGQLFAFYVAGVYLYKLTHFLTKQSSLGLKTVSLFYLFQLAFGFGGFYGMQLATPFVFIGLWLAVTAWADYRRDEVFMAQGLAAALSLSLAPITLSFWLLLLMTAVLVNARRGLWARGFYQALASIFGAILVLYPVAYFVLNLQLATPYLEQAFLSPFAFNLTFGTPTYVAMGVVLAISLATGLLTGLLLLPIYLKKMAEQRAALLLLTLSTLTYFVLVLFSQTIVLEQFLVLLPFGLLLTMTALGQPETEEERVTFSRRHPSYEKDVFFQRNHLYLPLLFVLGSFSWTGYRFLVNQPLVAERQYIAAYLVAETGDDSKISAWDNSAQIYLDSQRLSATTFPVVTVNTAKSNTKSLLEDEFLRGEADYLVVNRSIALPSSIKKKLDDRYEQIDLEGVSHFALYRAK